MGKPFGARSRGFRANALCPGCKVKDTTPKKGVCGICWRKLTPDLKMEWWDVEEEKNKAEKQKIYFTWIENVEEGFREMEAKREREDGDG